jgi:hypothetical protein
MRPCYAQFGIDLPRMRKRFWLVFLREVPMKYIDDVSSPPGLYQNPTLNYAEPTIEPDPDPTRTALLIECGYQEWANLFGRPCAHCGTGFVPKHPTRARYCSASCRAMASQKRLGHR